MSVSDFLRNLLDELRHLYNQIAVMLLHKRMDGYHRHMNHSKKSYAADIKASLLEYVDNVIVIEKEKNKISNSITHPVYESEAINKCTPKSQHTTYPFNLDKKYTSHNPFKLNRKQVGELSRYFKTRKKGTELHPGIEEKLKSSVWDHINASIQCAFRGDSRNAKMHVDIANYALKEIAHYMPEEKYLVLTEKINKRLDALKENQ